MQSQVSNEAKRTAQHLESLAVQTFSTESGKLLLEYLKEHYLQAEVFSSAVAGDKQATYAAFREGENSVIRKLVTLYKRGTQQ